MASLNEEALMKAFRQSRRANGQPCFADLTGSLPPTKTDNANDLQTRNNTMSNDSPTATEYRSFKAFYPFYLSQHQNIVCRRLHFMGSLLILAILTTTIMSGKLGWLFAVPVAGYGFAWLGHFVFEKNRPATFTYPIYSLMGDWVMFWDILIGKISLKH
jgi:hypothetical protein